MPTGPPALVPPNIATTFDPGMYVAAYSERAPGIVIGAAFVQRAPSQSQVSVVEPGPKTTTRSRAAS
ncbi:MAG: hypothetical protein QM704_05275 [Anaeromyxobacteraceae bacterium]